MNRTTILNLLSKRPLFLRFLKETNILGEYICNVLTVEYSKSILTQVPNESLVSGIFVWGARGIKLPAQTWVELNKIWRTLLNNQTPQQWQRIRKLGDPHTW